MKKGKVIPKFRYGRLAYLDEEMHDYRYTDDNSLVGIGGTKACPKCNKKPRDYKGHDPCIANLPGVFRACCGHGVRPGHIKFLNGIVIRGFFTVKDNGRPYTDEEVLMESQRILKDVPRKKGC